MSQLAQTLSSQTTQRASLNDGSFVKVGSRPLKTSDHLTGVGAFQASQGTLLDSGLNIVQRGLGYEQALKAHGFAKQKQLADLLGGKKRASDICRALKVVRNLGAHPDVLDLIMIGRIKESTAVYLAGIKDDAELKAAVAEAVDPERGLKRDAAAAKYGTGKKRAKGLRPVLKPTIVRGKFRSLTFLFDQADAAAMKADAVALLAAIDRAIELKIDPCDFGDFFNDPAVA